MRFRLLILTMLLMTVGVRAQTVSWSIPPRYNSIEVLSPTLLKVRVGELFGLMDYNGAEIAPCRYTAITPFSGGYCLLLMRERLGGMATRDGSVRFFDDPLFIDPEYPCFSEGMLAVRDEGASWTYMDTEGNFPIRALFMRAAPFCSGLAAVQEKSGEGSYGHIDRSGRFSKLSQDFTDNYLIFASSFTDVGGQSVAVVVDGHENVWFRDLRGGKVMDLGRLRSYDKESRLMTTRKYRLTFSEDKRLLKRESLEDHSVRNFEQTSPVVYYPPRTSLSFPSEGTKVGLRTSSGDILPPQFSLGLALDDRHAIVESNGGVGVLEIRDGTSPSCSVETDHLTLWHRGTVRVPLHLNAPRGTAKVTVLQDGKPCYEGTPLSDGFTVECQPNDGALMSLTVQMTIDGLVYPNRTFILPFSYEEAFQAHIPASVTLNESNTAASFTVSVENIAPTASAPCDILVDGHVVREGVVFEPGERIGVGVTLRVNLEDLDSVSRDVRVLVRENGAEPWSRTGRVQFLRNFNP